MRERALAVIEGFDPTSVVATSRFITSGSQLFTAGADLASLKCPALSVCGDDPSHPSELSDLYTANIPGCTAMPASTTDVAGLIGTFVDQGLRCGA